MPTLNRMTRKNAEAEGFTVDTNCYPWFAYKGPRFNPTERRDVFTDLEAELLQLQTPEEYEGYVAVTGEEIRQAVQSLKEAWLSGDAGGTQYSNLTAKVVNAVAKTFLLQGYLHECTEGESDGTGGPLLTFNFRRSFGQTPGLKFIAEALIMVSAEGIWLKAMIRRTEEKLPLYDAYGFHSVRVQKIEATLVEMAQSILAQSRAQVDYVLSKERMTANRTIAV